MLVVAVISVDTLAFSDLTYHLDDTGVGVFWLYHLIVRRPNLKVATKRLPHQQVKITG